MTTVGHARVDSCTQQQQSLAYLYAAQHCTAELSDRQCRPGRRVYSVTTNDDKNMTLRRRQDTSLHRHHHQQQQQHQRDDGSTEATACKKKSRTDRQRRKEKIRYNGVCGYYICYSIFVAVVGLMLLVVLLTLHLIRCIVVVSDKSVYDCFIAFELGHTQRRHSIH